MSTQTSSPLKNLVAVYVSHKEAPFDRIGSLNDKIDYIYSIAQAEGLVILSTCNRFEVYLDSPSDISSIKELIESYTGNVGVLRGEKAAKRLMRIAAGLESAILGDYEIMAQIRKAMNDAYQRGKLSRLLDVLFRSALMAGKRVRTETEISKGGIGYPFAAVVLAKRKLGRRPQRVLIYGTGKVAKRLLELLCESTQKIYVVSRELERAKKASLACEKALPVTLDKLDGRKKFDALFIAVSGYTLSQDIVYYADIVVDLSIPPVVEKIRENIYRLEDLVHIVKRTIESRAKWIPLAEKIIDEELESLKSKLLEERVSFLIRKIIRYNENVLESFSNNGNVELLKRFSNKLLHPLFISLRQASREAVSFEDFLKILDKTYGD